MYKRQAFGASSATAALTKSRFLMDYPAIGAERSLAWNKSLKTTDALWNSLNISGLEPVSYTHLDVYKRQTAH